jgi:predicted component of type VI protein secretion system
MKTPHDPQRKTFGWLLPTLMGGSLILLGTGCSSTSEDEMTYSDIEVTVPSEAEANAAASQAITADNADAALQQLDDEVANDEVTAANDEAASDED